MRNPTKDEYVLGSMHRILDAAKSAHEPDPSSWLCTAIVVELKTMYELGRVAGLEDIQKMLDNAKQA